jgi:hypothetical protein
VEGYDPGAGFTGIELVLPAGLACPSAAEHALLELRNRKRRIAEVAHVPCEAARVFLRRFPLLAHHRDLFSYLFKEIRIVVTF